MKIPGLRRSTGEDAGSGCTDLRIGNYLAPLKGRNVSGPRLDREHQSGLYREQRRCLSSDPQEEITTMESSTAPETEREPEKLVERLFANCIGAFELLCVHLGHRLGLYRALRAQGPRTPPELAAATGIDRRYAREWLEQQASAGILVAEGIDAGPDERTYTLPPGYAEVLCDPESLNYAVPFAPMLVCVTKPIDELVEAFRTGAGVHHSRYEPEHREAQGAFSRPPFTNLLASDWVPTGLPDVHERLLSDPPARVADIGCGLGWACIALARAYPKARIDGFDTDAPSVAQARGNAEDAEVSGRVSFHASDPADASLDGGYDLVCMFEVLHDVARPVELLGTVKRMLAPGGAALVVDERVPDRFSAPGDEIERFMYTCSVLHCLPIARVEEPSAATGTVMRPDTVREYATQAGFDEVEILPVENDFFRFYRLRLAL